MYQGNEQQQVEAIVTGRGGTVITDEGMKYMSDPTHMGELQVQWHIARENYETGQVRPCITGTVQFDAKQVQAALNESLRGIVGKIVLKM